MPSAELNDAVKVLNDGSFWEQQQRKRKAKKQDDKTLPYFRCHSLSLSCVLSRIEDSSRPSLFSLTRGYSCSSPLAQTILVDDKLHTSVFLQARKYCCRPLFPREYPRTASTKQSQGTSRVGSRAFKRRHRIFTCSFMFLILIVRLRGIVKPSNTLTSCRLLCVDSAMLYFRRQHSSALTVLRAGPSR